MHEKRKGKILHVLIHKKTTGRIATRHARHSENTHLELSIQHKLRKQEAK